MRPHSPCKTFLRGAGTSLTFLVAACSNRASPSGTIPDAGGARWSSALIATPPTYLGTVDDAGGCEKPYRAFGYDPVGPENGRHPLFLYFAGTTFVADDASTHYDSQAAQHVTEAMARRGFVALSIEYDNGAVAWASDHEAQLACLFGSNPTSVLAASCALPEVDCDLGIATWGHSQGALVADLAANYDTRVRAAWTTGYGGDSRATLSTNRLRVVNGEGDTSNAEVPGLDKTTGFAATECPDDGRKECLRADGSGWIIVQKADCAVTSADHCWFDKKTCLDTPETLEPNWINPASMKPFALESNADWVLSTVFRK